MNRGDFSPHEYHRHLLAGARPALAFRDDGSVRQWQTRLRRKLRELLAVTTTHDPRIAACLQPDHETEEFVCDRVVFCAEPGADVPGYLLMPKHGAPPFPVMICLQGHSPGAHISIGRGQTAAEVESIRGGRDIAVQAVRNGWAALAIEQRGFGRRRGPTPGCADIALHALLLGRTLLGERVFDVSRAIDFLATRQDLDMRRIGCMGNSAGGTTSFFAACVDRRIRLAVVSCAFCAYADSWLLLPHCACGYVPGLLKYADMGDLAGLIAPRHLLVVAGKSDPIARLRGVKSAFKQAQRAFRALGRGPNLRLLLGDGGHQFYPDLAWPAIVTVVKGWLPDRRSMEVES